MQEMLKQNNKGIIITSQYLLSKYENPSTYCRL